MNNLLPELGTGTNLGLGWSTWLAIGGFGLFCLLGVWAVLLIVSGKDLPKALRILQPPSLRGRVVLAFALAATLPALSLALVLADRTTGTRIEAAATILQLQGESAAKFANNVLARYASELSDAAREIAPVDSSGDPSVEAAMIRAQQRLADLSALFLTDETGRILASTVSRDGRIEARATRVGEILTDDYVVQPLRSGEPFVSDGIPNPERDGARSAAIAVPVFDGDGAVAGALVGFSNLVDLTRWQERMAKRGEVRGLLLDRAGRVVFATANSAYSTADELSNNSFLYGANQLTGQIFDFSLSPRTAAGSSIAANFRLHNGWRMLVYVPRAGVEDPLLDDYMVMVAWIVGTLLIAVCLGLAVARSIADPLQDLEHSVTDFDLNMNQAIPESPASAPREMRSVFRQLRALDQRMRATYRTLRKAVQQGEKLRGELIYVIANREKEIKERTEELAEANEKLSRLSREDSLTGLANRRCFTEFLARTWQAAMREKTPLSILIIDIDNFKIYNDTYGHQKGDTCLKLVADAISRPVSRASDLVARYGGEEFIVVLGDTPLEGGLNIAEKIRAAVERLGIPHEGAERHQCVTVSIGVTSTLPGHDTNPETVLVAADRAMYNAKNDGKNKVAYSTAARTGTYEALCVPGDAGSRPS